MKLVVPLAVGVPEIAPVLLIERPAGSDEPDASAKFSVPTPPLACTMALYAVPTVPPASYVLLIVGAVLTAIVDDADLVLSLIEVATIVTVILAVTDAGAL